VDDEDRAKGIKTIEDKLESMCPFFSRMDALFGERQNVIPSFVDDSTAAVEDMPIANNDLGDDNAFDMVSQIEINSYLGIK
jgi:t-SNARE complex subunit (syntaxin)